MDSDYSWNYFVRIDMMHKVEQVENESNILLESRSSSKRNFLHLALLIETLTAF